MTHKSKTINSLVTFSSKPYHNKYYDYNHHNKNLEQLPYIQKVIWIANKHLHNYNLQNNPHYQVKCHFMIHVDDDGEGDDEFDLDYHEDDNVDDKVECGEHLFWLL